MKLDITCFLELLYLLNVLAEGLSSLVASGENNKREQFHLFMPANFKYFHYWKMLDCNRYLMVSSECSRFGSLSSIFCRRQTIPEPPAAGKFWQLRGSA